MAKDKKGKFDDFQKKMRGKRDDDDDDHERKMAMWKKKAGYDKMDKRGKQDWDQKQMSARGRE